MAENIIQPTKPGETISPTAATQPVKTVSAPVVEPVAAPSEPKVSPVVATKPTDEKPEPETAAPADVPDDSPEAQTTDSSPTSNQPDEVISWEASEFITHQKSTGWYIRLALAGIIIAAAIWLLTRDTIASLVTLFCTFVLGYYASRQPRQLQYKLDDQGVMIGEKFIDYQEFRSFAIMQEGAFDSLVFMPLRRFAQLTTIYYAPELAERIVAFLSDRLPMEERKPDTVDRFMSRIRF